MEEALVNDGVGTRNQKKPLDVLIVDDSSFLRNVLKGHLSKLFSPEKSRPEIVFREANSRESALAKIMEETPDLVFLDIVMGESERDGIEILKVIRKMRLETNVVVVTSLGQPVVERECRELNIIDYIVKPFDEEEIWQVAKKYLTGRGQQGGKGAWR